MRNVLIFICLLFINAPTSGQVNVSLSQDSTVLFKCAVKVGDTVVNLHPCVQLKRTKQLFFIKKNNIFNQGEMEGTQDGRVFLQRRMLFLYVNLSLDKLTQMPIYDSKSRRYLKVGDNDLAPIPINAIFPLEKGMYRVRIELDYYEGYKKKTMYSDWVEFECLHDYSYW
jgi:hypothetical protein